MSRRSLRSVRDAPADGKRVLLRVDFNVPVQDGRITDDTRIRAALPTLQLLLDRSAAVILCSHLGRPQGKADPQFSLRPVADRLAELLSRNVALANDVVGRDAQDKARGLRGGEALLLENVRFEPGEEQNDSDFAGRLAALAQLYVNDAFGAVHRAHASTAGIAARLPAYAGLLMEEEISALSKLLDEPDRPYLAILGGAKVSDKLGVLVNLLARVDSLIIGGGMANTFLLAEGIAIGNSLAEHDLARKAAEIMVEAKQRAVEVLLPQDVVIAADLDSGPSTVPVDEVPAEAAIFDIGPATAARYAEAIDGAGTIFWNGPMGVFERPAFTSGTRAVAQAVAVSGAYSVVGGGDSIAAIEQLGVAGKISHVSTGGGASLEFIEGRELPGLAPLWQNG